MKFLIWAFLAACVLIIALNKYYEFVIWRCRQVYDNKAKFWILPCWSLWRGYLKYRRLERLDAALLQKEYQNIKEWIFYRFQSENSITPEMAKHLAFVGFCSHFFAKQPV